MRRFLAFLFLAALIGLASVAAEMSPEELMAKFMSCPACAPYMEYPELQTGMQFDTQKTAHGMIMVEILTDDGLVPKFRECEAKLAVTREAAMKLSPTEAGEELCPFCAGFHTLVARGDVGLEDVKLKHGTVTLANSTTEEGVAAVHAYVDKANEIMAMMEGMSAKEETPEEQ